MLTKENCRTNPESDEKPLIALITTESGDHAVSARELHKFIESNERFSKWIERMFEYGFDSGIDYTPYQKVHPLNKQTFQDFALTLDTAKEVAMIQRNEKGRMARRFFIECEKKLRVLITNTIHVPQAGLIEQIAKLERKFDLLRKERVRYFKARVILRHQERYQKQKEKEVTEHEKERAVLFNLLERYRKVENYSSGYTILQDISKALKSYYCLDLDSKPRFPGEHNFDVAIKMGKGHCVAEVIRCHLYKSGELK